MLNTLTMQARGNSLPSTVKLHMRMDERSGLYITDQVSRAQYNPSSVGAGGSLSFATANAVGITNNSDLLLTPALWNITLQTNKVCLLAACIKQLAGTGTRVAIGAAGETNVLTVSSIGANGLHGYFTNTDQTDGAQIAPIAGYAFSNTSSPFIHYALWDGVNTFTVKVIDLNGAVHNNGTNNLLRTTTATFTASSITLGQGARLTNGYYYGMTCWELDHVPRSIDYKLAGWGNSLINGYKGAIELV